MGPGHTAFTRIWSARVIRRHAPRQPGHRGLGGVVLRRLAHARHGADRRDVDDAAAAALTDDRDRRFRAERVPLEVDAEDLVPALRAGLDHRVIEPDPGVVHEDVEPAEAIRRLLDEARGVDLAPHVGFDEERLTAARLDLRHDALAAIGVAVGKRHLRAFRHEPSHRGLTDARRPAGDGGDLPTQSCHARPCLSRVSAARARSHPCLPSASALSASWVRCSLDHLGRFRFRLRQPEFHASSASRRVSGIAAQLASMKGPWLRGPC